MRKISGCLSQSLINLCEITPMETGYESTCVGRYWVVGNEFEMKLLAFSPLSLLAGKHNHCVQRGLTASNVRYCPEGSLHKLLNWV